MWTIISKIPSGSNIILDDTDLLSVCIEAGAWGPHCWEIKKQKQKQKQREPSEDHMNHSAYRGENKPGNAL